MHIVPRATGPVAALVLYGSLALYAAPARAEPHVDPFRFFEGQTETEGTIKVALKRPIRTHSAGRGRIEPNGTLVLVQQVKEGRNPLKERRWVIRRIGPGRYAGTMTEAAGPVRIDQVGGRYRFRFRMKGGLNAEQWVTPLPDGVSASSLLAIRKLGLTVATSTGTIRKLAR